MQGPTDSVFLAGWPRDLKLEVAKGEEESWLALRELRDAVNKTLEMARKDKFIGSSLEAEVTR